MSTTVTTRHPLAGGKPIRFRLAQQIAWGVILGTLAFGLLASGLYFGLTQVNWHLFWLKPGWDGGMGLVGPRTWLINTANWSQYRHAYRDIGLPALATMGALSITGGARKPAPRWYTAVAPVLVLAAAVVLITAGVWLKLRVNVTSAVAGLPAHWLALLIAAESVVLGILIGQVLHRIWRPAGTRIQAFLVERVVDRHFRRGGTGYPYWVTHDVAPPTAREAGAKLVDADVLSGEAQQLRAEGHTAKSSAIYWAAGAIVLLVAAVDFVGFIGHVWVGILGHSFPFLAP